MPQDHEKLSPFAETDKFEAHHLEIFHKEICGQP